MTISFIVAAAENNVIGKNNQLPWHLPADMKFFKNTTWGLPVIMGRRTLNEFGGKPLPGRLNIVITRQKDFKLEGTVVVHSIKDALFVASDADAKEVFIIGGGEIFKEAMPIADRIYITRVHAEVEGDTYFPEIDEKKWRRVSQRSMPADEKHAYNFTFELWEKK